jgi:hypothetical protein
MIVGRTARDTIRNPITDETIVTENEIITNEIADAIKELKLESIRVRSPLTCESPRGVCARCYGIDMSTNRTVEEGLAVGIIAAQSIGEPGTQLTMRTFHTGGVAQGGLIENDIKTVNGGIVQHRDINAVPVTDVEGGKHLVALKRNGEIAILDAKGREIEKYKVPYGASVMAADGEKVKSRQQLVVWDPHITPILAEKGGVVRYEDIEEGETARLEEERKGSGLRRWWRRQARRHRAQGRASPAHHDRRVGRQDPRLPLPAGQGSYRSHERSEDRRRSAPRPSAEGIGRHDGHHRRSPPRHGNLRGPQAEGPRRARRDLGHDRAALGSPSWQDDRADQERDRHGKGAPRPAGP